MKAYAFISCDYDFNEVVYIKRIIPLIGKNKKDAIKNLINIIPAELYGESDKMDNFMIKKLFGPAEEIARKADFIDSFKKYYDDYYDDKSKWENIIEYITEQDEYWFDYKFKNYNENCDSNEIIKRKFNYFKNSEISDYQYDKIIQYLYNFPHEEEIVFVELSEDISEVYTRQFPNEYFEEFCVAMREYASKFEHEFKYGTVMDELKHA
jgi:hypothetical protein